MRRDSRRHHDGASPGKLLFVSVLTACLACFAVAGSTLMGTSRDAGIVSVTAVYAPEPGAPSPAPSSLEAEARAILEAARGGFTSELLPRRSLSE